MTVLHDENAAPAAPSAPEAVSRPVASSEAGDRVLAAARLAGAQAKAWVLQDRVRWSLLLPVAAYLMLIAVLMMGKSGLIVAGLALAALATFGPRLPADTILSLYRAEPIAPGQGLALRAAIEALAQRAGLTTPPALAIVPSFAVGAFSAGVAPRAAILMTEGLLRRHSLREIVTIAAHEIAHMRAGDLPVFALADTVTRLAQALCYLGVLLLGIEAVAFVAGEHAVSLLLITLLLAAPLLSSQLQLNLPRQREYDADRIAAHLLGDVDAVVAVALSMEPDFGAPLDDLRWPVPQRRSPIPSPLRAHISGAERAERLRTGELPPLLPRLVIADEPLVSLVGVGPIGMRPRNRWPGLWF
jgi:heat shock protein HtpX